MMVKKANQEKIPAEVKYKHGGREVEIEVIWKKPSEIFSRWTEEMYYLSSAIEHCRGDLHLSDFKRLREFSQDVANVSCLALSPEDYLAPYYIKEGKLKLDRKHLTSLKLRVTDDYGEVDEESYCETMKKLCKLAMEISRLNPIYTRISDLQVADRLCDMVRDLIDASCDS
jgi:hypothetical protein